MRRSICVCEPSHARAGEENTWTFIYTTATALPKGSRLKFDMGSKGRDIDWQIPNASPKANGNAIYAITPDKKTLFAKVIETADSFTPQFEFTLASSIPVGGQFVIIVGRPKGAPKGKKNGNTAQCNSQRRRSFLLFVDPTGKGVYDEPEVFSFDVRGGPLKNIRVLTPSFVAKNRRFDVIVRFEDEFGNLSNNAPDDTLIELSYENLRENLSWRLFVPETGFIALPNLYFNEIGVYTICLKNMKTGEVFRSAPLKCFPENSLNLFWGLLHGESERYDSTENIENCLRHIRDDCAMNFFASSPFESAEETSAEAWKLVSQNVTEFQEDDRFVTFLGLQMEGTPSEEGIRQILYAKDSKPLIRRKDAKYASLKKLYKAFNPKDIIAIPSFTMGKGFSFDFTRFQPEFERVVEIYNAWGSSESTAKEGNPRPIKGAGKAGVQEVAEGSIQNALKANHRFGFVAGGLDDRGIYNDFFDSDQIQYSPGLTAVLAKDQTRASLFEALYNRSCYATTGARMIVTFSLSGAPMGSEITTADKPGCLINRHITGTVAGTTQLKLLEIIRNGKVIKTIKPDGYWMNYVFDDMDPLAKITIAAKDGKPPFVYYYVRLTQADGHIAWSSPIWIDHVPPVAGRGRRAIPKATKKAPAVVISETPDAEDEEDDELDYDE
jgi:hypothetical protein